MGVQFTDNYPNYGTSMANMSYSYDSGGHNGLPLMSGPNMVHIFCTPYIQFTNEDRTPLLVAMPLTLGDHGCYP